MKVLVTGATGFIGSEIVSRLISERIEVAGLSKTGAGRSSSIKITASDITDERDVLSRFQGETFDAVIHCAGLAHQFGRIDEKNFENVNVRGSGNIARLAAKTKAGHFMLLSSTAVYGINDAPVDESTPCRPETAYAKSKLEAEDVCRKICERYKIPLTIFRPAPVLGEKGVGNVPRLIDAINKRRFFWIGDGENQKSLIYVGDIAGACLNLLKTKRDQTEVFNLASKPIKMRTLVSIISEKLKKPVANLTIPVFVPELIFNINSKTLKLKRIEAAAKTFEKWLSDDIYIAEKISADYNFAPGTSVEQAVSKQCEWFLEAKHRGP